MSTKRMFYTSVVLAALSACADGEGAHNVEMAPEKNEPLTYHRDLRAVIEANCQACHRSDGIAPFALEKYEDLIAFIPLIIDVVESGKMPPWSAADNCHEIADSRRLDDETRGLFRKWRDDGMEEGDPDDYVEPEPESEVAAREPLGDPSRTLEMERPYVPAKQPAGTEDEHRCFLLPGTIEEETYMRAMRVSPSSRLVHHLQVHRIPADSVAAAEARDDAAEGDGYPCFGGSAPGSYNLFSWHPGAETIRFDDDTAAYLPPGSRIALQIHFNLDAYAEGDEIPEEQTNVKLWLLPEGELPDYVVVRFFLSGGFVNLPAGDDSIMLEQTTQMGTVGVEGGAFAPGEFVGHTPHMHWLGKQFVVWMQPSGGAPACLIDVPRWDFNWQLDYWYPRTRYIPFRADDFVTVRCGYDNSAQNQRFVEGRRVEPRQVLFGESSSDEMCLNHTWVRYKREAYLAARSAPPPAAANPFGGGM